MNKFEQVSSAHHQMSLVGVSRSDGQGGTLTDLSQGKGRGALPYDLAHDTFDVTYPTETPVKTLPSRNFFLRAVTTSGLCYLLLL